jgi:hypothetical protein
MAENMTIGQVAYNAYMDFSGGVSLISGQKLPEWDAQDQHIKAAWEHSALAVSRIWSDVGPEVKVCTREHYHEGPCNGFPRSTCPQGRRA